MCNVNLQRSYRGVSSEARFERFGFPSAVPQPLDAELVMTEHELRPNEESLYSDPRIATRKIPAPIRVSMRITGSEWILSAWDRKRPRRSEICMVRGESGLVA